MKRGSVGSGRRESMYGRIVTIFPVLFTIILMGALPAWAVVCDRVPAKDIPSALVLKNQRTSSALDFIESNLLRGEKAEKNYKEDEILVKFKSGVSEDGKKGLHRKHGSIKIKEFASLHIHQVKLKKGLIVADAIRLYQEDPDVEYAEPNYVVVIQAAPNDPRFGELWGLHNTGQTGGTNDADIDAPEAWDITTGNSNVVVAVIDSGVDYTHPDLAANMWVNTGEIPGNGIDDDGNGYIDDIYGIDTYNNDGNPFDDNGHGTHCSGTIGAVGNNGIGVAGVNWNVKIMACKFLNAGGNGYTSDAVECLQYIKAMKDKGVNVIATSNSWGGGGYSQALYDAINLQREILFVAAAGNNSDNTDWSSHYPSSYDLPNVIGVAATDHNENIAYFSNYGRKTVHVGAPGQDILSTLPATNYWGITGGYGNLSGTSMATPHVTGLAALVKSQDMNRDWRAIKNLILSGGDSVSSMNGKTITGKRINASGSLSCSGHIISGNSGSAILSPLKYPSEFPLQPGTPVTLSVLSINCADSFGPVTATTSGGETISLFDNGIAPDLAAGDGIFTGTWTPLTAVDALTFSSPAGTVMVPPLVIVPYLPEANINAFYRQSLEAWNAEQPYIWSLISGALPDGLSLNASSGEIFGTPTTLGKSEFTIGMQDALNRTAVEQMSIQVTDDTVVEIWARAYNGQSSKIPHDIALDAAGNIYVTGESTGQNNEDFLTIKYDQAGNFLWSKTHDSGGDDWAEAVGVDKGGNIYVAGGCPYFYCTSDFNIVKYDSDGNVLWTRVYDKGGYEYPTALAVDESNNAYVTGFTLSASGLYYDALTIKYSPAGDLLWEKTYNSADVERAFGITIDSSGNIYVAGDRAYPGTGGGYAYQYLTIKYDPSGNVLWNKTYDGIGARDVAVDGNQNVYVAGGTRLIKYDPSGMLLWTKLFQTPDMGVNIDSITVDGNGDIDLVGFYYDFNESKWAYVISKWDSSGNILWNKKIAGDMWDLGSGITVDKNNNIFVTRTLGSDYLTSKFSEVLNVRTQSLSAGMIGVSYNQQVLAAGGLAPYSWSVIAGLLPDGLVLDNSTGVLSGTPTLTGTFSFTIQATDASLSKAAKTLSITITNDTTPPTGTILINSGASSTDSIHVTLKLTCDDGGGMGCAEMHFSNDGISWSGWEAFAASKSWTLTDGVGTKTVFAQFQDAAGNISFGFSDSIILNSSIDLIISALTAPSTAGAGVTILVADTTKNSGAGSADPSTTSFYLSTDSTLDSNDALLGSRAVPALAAGASSPGTTSVAIPADTPAGSYYVIARADADDMVAETREDNNTKYSTSIRIGPDLVISAVTAPSTAGAGLSITVTDTTQNSGAGSAAPSTTNFYLSTDSSLDPNDALLGSRSVDSIAAGASSPGTTSVTIPTGTLTGSYYVIAKADGFDMVAETREDNNTKYSTSIKIGPDLVILAVTAPSTAGAGASISVTDTTQNSGAGSAAPSTTSFYLSTDSTLDPNDALLGSRSVDSIAAGASSSGTTLVLIPTGTPSGSYYVIVKADAADMVAETREDNNTKYSTSIKIGPDLTMTAVAAPTTAGAGKTTSVTDTTKNSGAGDAEPSTTSFYLSTDATLDGADVKIGNRTVDALVAGASSSGTTSVTIPGGTLTGAYYIIARADAADMVAEIREDNNTKYSTTIKIGPDLVVLAVTAPSTAGAGASISVADTTKNGGGGESDPSTTRFYLSTDSTLDSNDALLGSRTVPVLAAGESSSGTTSVIVPTGTPSGYYYVIARADAADIIAETREDNNTKYSTSVKVGPDLTVYSMTAPSSAKIGATISVTDTTMNSGAGAAASSTTGFYLSTDTNLDASDTKIGSRTVDALAAGASSSGTTSVTIPAGTLTGTYYIIGKADAEGLIPETSETNNTRYKSISITVP